MKKVTPKIQTPVKKIVNQHGKWVFKPTKSIILKCICGNKYIASRKDQVMCVNCTYSKVAR